VTIGREESVPNVWNGTMFGDLDWPLNASRGFVSISWASCIHWLLVVSLFSRPSVVQLVHYTTCVQLHLVLWYYSLQPVLPICLNYCYQSILFKYVTIKFQPILIMMTLLPVNRLRRSDSQFDVGFRSVLLYVTLWYCLNECTIWRNFLKLATLRMITHSHGSARVL